MDEGSEITNSRGSTPAVEMGDFRGLRPPEPADAIVTDPPYNIGHKYGAVRDNIPEDQYLEMMLDFANWSFDNTKDDAHLFVIHRPQFFFKYGHMVFVEGGGWEYSKLIRWCYNSNTGMSKRSFTTSSRDILWLKKGNPHFNPKADPEPYLNPTDKRVKTLIESGSPGRAPYDWWVVDIQKNVGKEYAGYSNQIPTKLLRRIILSATAGGGAGS